VHRIRSYVRRVPFEVRSIAAADVDRVHAINEANVPEVGSVTVDRLRFLIDESPIALAVDDVPDDGEAAQGSIVGFCLVLAPGSVYDSTNYRWFMEHRPDAWYLDRVAIDEAARGRGLGGALYDEVERRLAELGVDALTLEVNSDPPNEVSLRFHRSRGFVELTRRMTPYGIEVSMMERRISDDRR